MNIGDFRIGLGQDSHRFTEDQGKGLVLAGLKIEKEKGLEGDSDGDVVIHALCRAIEQALGNPDFHSYSGPMCREGVTDSREYLKVAMSHVKEKGYVINNIGIAFECQKPKISPLSEGMKKNLALILEIAPDQIGINASTGEDLTNFGKGEGIQVLATVSLIKS